jgi:aminocarboxymuconate-semialdehyde decarboxylase
MKKQIGCGCGKGISRRRVLQTGLAAAAAGAMSGVGDVLAESPTQAAEGQGISAAGVRTVDIHSHYYPEAYLNLFNEDGKRFNAEYRMTDRGFFYKTPITPTAATPLATKFIDLKQRVADMDQQGVGVQALSLTMPMVYWGDAELDHKLAVAWNDSASAAHQSYPARFVGLCTLPMLYPDRAIEELNRASKLPGIRGVYAGTNINNKDLSDPLFEPIWTRMEELDLPVFLHPLQTIGGDRLRKFFLYNLLGNPFDTAVAACHLIFGGVLDRHPKLRVASRRRRASDFDGTRGPRLGSTRGGKATPEGAKQISRSILLRYDRALEAGHGVCDQHGGRGARHDRERLLLRDGL